MVWCSCSCCYYYSVVSSFVVGLFVDSAAGDWQLAMRLAGLDRIGYFVRGGKQQIEECLVEFRIFDDSGGSESAAAGPRLEPPHPFGSVAADLQLEDSQFDNRAAPFSDPQPLEDSHPL